MPLDHTPTNMLTRLEQDSNLWLYSSDNLASCHFRPLSHPATSQLNSSRLLAGLSWYTLVWYTILYSTLLYLTILYPTLLYSTTTLLHSTSHSFAQWDSNPCTTLRKRLPKPLGYEQSLPLNVYTLSTTLLVTLLYTMICTTIYCIQHTRYEIPDNKQKNNYYNY